MMRASFPEVKSQDNETRRHRHHHLQCDRHLSMMTTVSVMLRSV
jgi:hypothetical protein